MKNEKTEVAIISETVEVIANTFVKKIAGDETMKTCMTCQNPNCFIVYGVPQDKKKDCKEHHECYDWNKVFDCKNHNKYKGKSTWKRK